MAVSGNIFFNAFDLSSLAETGGSGGWANVPFKMALFNTLPPLGASLYKATPTAATAASSISNWATATASAVTVVTGGTGSFTFNASGPILCTVTVPGVYVTGQTVLLTGFSGSGTTATLTSAAATLGGELATADGYTVGGVSLISPTHVVYTPSTWETYVTAVASAAYGTWTISTAYGVNQIVGSSGNTNFLYRCVVSGNSTGSPPSQVTEGALDTVATTAQFVNCGQSIEIWSSNNAVWNASGSGIGPASYGVLYDPTNFSNVLLISFGTAQTAAASTPFTVVPDPVYGWFATLPQ